MPHFHNFLKTAKDIAGLSQKKLLLYEDSELLLLGKGTVSGKRSLVSSWQR